MIGAIAAEGTIVPLAGKPLRSVRPWGILSREEVCLPLSDDDDFTRLIEEIGAELPGTSEKFLESVYEELRRLAHYHMRRENQTHTLQTTALVHEAYIRLCGHQIDWVDRNHFFAVAGRVMRRILVDHARARKAAKRNGIKVELGEWMLVADENIEQILAVDQVLGQLAKEAPRQAKFVELHLFTGLSLQETAEVLGISVRTAHRDWNMAQAWLFRRMGEL